MAIKRKVVSRDNAIYHFCPTMVPIKMIRPGEIISIETNDCFRQQITSEDQAFLGLDHETLNPATGPVYVEGAEPGDLLRIEIMEIDVDNKGVVVIAPGEGILGDQIRDPLIKVVNIVNNKALLCGTALPIKPMIGVIGVAPRSECGKWATETPWKHGGNMDTKDILAGSTLYLPVNQKGALLALGDCHAIMGDGEICFTGLEVPATVTLKIDFVKNKTSQWPLLETSRETMVIVSGDDLEQAVYVATDQATNLIKDGLQIKWAEAYILAGLVVDIKISQVVNPKVTVRAAIPNFVISTEQIIESL